MIDRFETRTGPSELSFLLLNIMIDWIMTNAYLHSRNLIIGLEDIDKRMREM